MESKKQITINVSEETWQRIIARKKRPSHTFDEILREALLEYPDGSGQ